jgi:transposase-like protein
VPNLEEMMAERGISGDHATTHRWGICCSIELLERFTRRKRAVTGRWHGDETSIKVRGRWMYLYRAIDRNGDTVEFWFSERRNLTAAKRFLRKALERHGPRGSGSTVARATGRRSCPVIRQTDSRIGRGAN